MTEAELAELERLIAYKRQQGLTELRLTLDDADKLLSLARRYAKLEGALREAKDWIDPRTSPVPLTSMQMVARIDATLPPEDR